MAAIYWGIIIISFFASLAGTVLPLIPDTIPLIFFTNLIGNPKINRVFKI